MDTMEEAGDVMLTAWRLMEQKNADYGDSWREMRLSSITDQILVKGSVFSRSKMLAVFPRCQKESKVSIGTS